MRIIIVLLASLAVLFPALTSLAVETGDFVCVKKWGIRGNEGYCGRVEKLIDDEIKIRVTGGDGTFWRTKGTICSEGLNIKRLRLGQHVTVPISCLE